MKKFGKNDVFYNTLSANPAYKVVFYNGDVTVNDQLSEGNKLSSSITMLERNTVYTASLAENFVKDKFFYSASYTIQGNFSYNPQFRRSLIYSPFNNFSASYTDYPAIKKINALRNSFYKYSLDNSFCRVSNFLKNDGLPSYPTIGAEGQKTPLDEKSLGANYSPESTPAYFIQPTRSINLIEIPQAYYGIKIQPGTVNLKIYVTGTLVAEACDVYKNTKIIQTSSSYNSSLVGNEIGMVLYDEGIILLTGSSQLASAREPYIQPVSYTYQNGISKNYLSSTASFDTLKWIYFGSHKVTSTTTLTPIASASYEMNFQGSTERNTITMFCAAEKNDLTWSNNRTFISGGQGDKLVLGQTSSIIIEGTKYNSPTGSYFVPSNGQYFENDQLLIKNTISSSYSNYNASYKSQVFISEIGIYDEEGDLIAIAKLANPVRKTPELDYTFKLKLDI